ncbi:MAG: transposase [Candidatus Paceibacterota bacterium]
MRKISFIVGEYYHIYNRGVDKRSIFKNKKDLKRFLDSMNVFNSVETLGGLHLSRSESLAPVPRLVTFIAFCLNQNHYHFILRSLVEGGIQKFMHKLSTGYTNYFNERYERNGSLFQGPYKAVHIESNEQLLHASVYVNLNDRVHGDLNEKWLSELSFSSYSQYKTGDRKGFCDISVVLDQYGHISEYTKNAESILVDILVRKERQKAVQKMIIE